jgi:hypothetical protein
VEKQRTKERKSKRAKKNGTQPLSAQLTVAGPHIERTRNAPLNTIGPMMIGSVVPTKRTRGSLAIQQQQQQAW